MGKYFGILALAFFVNGCMFFVLKERIYFFNALYIILIFLFLLSDFHFDSLVVSSPYFGFWSFLNTGNTSKAMTTKLKLSEYTIDTHRKNIIRKTNAKSILAVINLAKEFNLIS
jgi:hypothetical protein